MASESVQNQGKPCVECGRYRRHLPTCSHASSKLDKIVADAKAQERDRVLACAERLHKAGLLTLHNLKVAVDE